MKLKVNCGVFAIETNAKDYGLSMAISILIFMLIDIFAYLKFNTLSDIQYLIYIIILSIEILIIIMLYRGNTERRISVFLKKLANEMRLIVNPANTTEDLKSNHRIVFTIIRKLKSDRELLTAISNKTAQITEDKVVRWTEEPIRILANQTNINPYSNEFNAIYLDAYTALNNLAKDIDSPLTSG